MNTIAIVGMGYVGLPLALQFACAGCREFGLDIDLHKASALNAGQSYIRPVPVRTVTAARDASTDFDFSRLPMPLVNTRDAVAPQFSPAEYQHA